jgi:hypothetical protein
MRESPAASDLPLTSSELAADSDWPFMEVTPGAVKRARVAFPFKCFAIAFLQCSCVVRQVRAEEGVSRV